MNARHVDRFDCPAGAALRELQRADALFQAFRDVSATLPASYARAFLVVAMRPGHSVSNYARELCMSQPVCSRIFLEIGKKTRTGGTGFGLLHSQQDNMDLRVHRYFLTAKGQKLAADVIKILESNDVLVA